MKACSPSLKRCLKNETQMSLFLFAKIFLNILAFPLPICDIGGDFMFYIPQIQKDDCGFACLKMMLANLNKDKNYLFIPQDENHGLYSFTDLTEIAYEYGLSLKGFKAEEKDELGKETSFPLILSLSLENDAKHAVLVTGVKFNRIFYLDPNKGKTSMPLKKFISIWDGTGLMIDDFNERKCPYQSFNPLSLTSRILLGFMEALIVGLVLLAVYFVKDGTPIYIPFIFLAGAILCELLLRAISYNMMKKLDDYFFKEELVPNDHLKDYLFRFEQFKKLSLSSPLHYVLLILTAISLVVLILLNDRRNALLVVVPLLLVLFDLFVINPFLKNKKTQIEAKENSLDSVNDVSSFKEEAHNLHKLAYDYSYMNLASAYIYAGLIIATALLTMHLCGISSTPYVIFYSCISLSLYKAMDAIVNMNEDIDEFNKVKVKLGNRMRRQKENE